MRTIDLLDGDFYVNDPYSDLRVDARARARVLGRHQRALGHLALRRRRRDREAQGRVHISDKEKGGYRPNLPADRSLIGLDDPLHTKRRNLVSRRFTPRAVGGVGGPRPRRGQRRCSTPWKRTAVRPRSSTSLAAPLPAMMIGKLLGFDDDRWRDLQDWSERTIALGGGPRYFDRGRDPRGDGVRRVRRRSCSRRSRRCPADDVMSVWTQAAIDGQPLTLDEVIPDCLLILDGGAETTRTVIARMILNLIERPDQWALLREGADLDGRGRGVHPLRHADPQHVPGRDRATSRSAGRPSARGSRSC